MASPARDAFLEGLAAFRTMADETPVRRGDPVGDFARRGLTVAGFNLLETFVADRLEECALHVNAGSLQFLDFPERLQRQAITNTVRVASSRLRRGFDDLADLRSFSISVGGSLTAVERSLALSNRAWIWDTSNMAVDDYRAILRAFHTFEPWTTADSLAARLGFHSADLKTALTDLVRERHRCAHEARYGVTSLWLRSIPNRVLALAAVLDLLVTRSCVELRASNAEFLIDENWLRNDRVNLRFIQERRRGAAELVEGATRARRVSTDGDQLFQEAEGRCAPGESVVRLDLSGGVVNWSVPAVG